MIGRCTLLEQTPEVAALADVGREIMSASPVVPGACVMMGALYAFRLQQRGHADAQLVGGALSVGGNRVFGRPYARHSFARANANWDGHAWVSLGGLIADASLVRTGLSQKAPARLRAFVEARFGLKEGLYIATADGAMEEGLGYEPQHVFSDDELVACCRGAVAYLKG